MKKKKMKDKPIKEQYQDKAQEVLERSSKMETKTLSDKIVPQICCKCGDTDLRVINTKDVKDFIKKLKEEIEDKLHNEFKYEENGTRIAERSFNIVNYRIDKLAGDALVHSQLKTSGEGVVTPSQLTTDNASYAKKVIASGRKITTEPEPIHYPKRTTDNASCPNPKENDHFCKHGTHITKIMGCIKCVEEKRGSDNKGCGKIEEEVFEGKVIETYVCGTRASEFNAVYLCDKCRTTDNKGCANPPKSLREYYLGEGEFDFERKIKKEMITDSPGKYSEEYQALKKFGSDKADYTNPVDKIALPYEFNKEWKTSGNQNCANCGHGRHTHYRLKGACYDECEKKCKKFISSNKEKSK